MDRSWIISGRHDLLLGNRSEVLERKKWEIDRKFWRERNGK